MYHLWNLWKISKKGPLRNRLTISDSFSVKSQLCNLLSRCITFRKELKRALNEMESVGSHGENDQSLDNCLSWRMTEKPHCWDRTNHTISSLIYWITTPEEKAIVHDFLINITLKNVRNDLNTNGKYFQIENLN